MDGAKEPRADSVTSKADAMALLDEAEAQAAEAEALAVAARARAVAARLRHEAANGEPEAEAAEPNPPPPPTLRFRPPGAKLTQPRPRPAMWMLPAAGAPEDPAEQSADESDSAVPDETTQAAQPKFRLARWRRRSPSLSATWKVAAIILIICFAAVSGCLVWQHREATRREERAARFVAGAKQGIVNMTSFGFNHAGEDVQRVIDSSTGQFRDEFQHHATDFTKVVEQSKLVTEGTVYAAAIESMDAHSASVLVSATSRITGSAGATNEPSAWRMRVKVTDDGGHYKISKVELVS